VRVLVADVGGTKTLVGVYDLERDELRDEQRYATADFGGVVELLDAHLDAQLDTGHEPYEAVGIGVPGPVVDGAAELPHLGWTVRAADLARRFDGLPVGVENDFVAPGLGLARVPASALELLKPGEAEPGAPRALIGAGTGLGEAVLLPERGGDAAGARGAAWSVLPSEGGHADFAPSDALQSELLAWLRRRFDHVSYDRVLTGAGLADLYAFLAETAGGGAPAVRAALERGDGAAAVVHHAERGDALCVRALEAFCTAYGAEAGNLALRSVATGGVYVAGGIAPRIARFLRGPAFASAFCAKGRLRPLVERVPVWLVHDTRAGLYGAAVAVLRERGDGRGTTGRRCAPPGGV